VEGLLPTPSYTDIIYSRTRQKIVLIYTIEGYITSPNQYRWISNIKFGLEKYLCVPFEYVEEFYISAHTEINTVTYQIKELSKAFNAPLIVYPKIMYPSHKKELYKRLCWYGARLIHQKCFTHEALTAAALLMNAKLKDKYLHKELHKKVLGAYLFIREHSDRLPKKLDEVSLKKARSKGGQYRRDQRVKQTRQKIDELLKCKECIKPNGKPNISLIAKMIKMNRKTVANHMQHIVKVGS